MFKIKGEHNANGTRDIVNTKGFFDAEVSHRFKRVKDVIPKTVSFESNSAALA